MVITERIERRDSGSSPKPLDRALQGIDSRAAELDRSPRFPSECFAYLKDASALQTPAVVQSGAFIDRLAHDVQLVRAVAAADGSTARILDGHLNGVERLALLAEEPLRTRELALVAAGELILGVWGADPAAEDGTPACLRRERSGLVLSGVKVFCSGAGGVDRALVIARDGNGDRRLVYVDTSAAAADSVTIDRGWYRASGMRASESHRVEFHDAPVVTVIGGPDALAVEPWFSRDAVRTAATWVGLTERIVQEAVADLDAEQLEPVRAYEIGRIRIAMATMDLWLERATATLSLELAQERSAAAVDRLATVAVQCRVALADHAKAISQIAGSVAGSRGRIGGTPLDRARRDLDLFVLQHRLESKVSALGVETVRTPHRPW